MSAKKNMNYAKNEMHTLTPKQGSFELELNMLMMNDVVDILDLKGKEFGDKAKALLQRTTELHELNHKFLMLLQSKLEIEKVSRNLQNYHDLEFKDFLKELKNTKMQLGLSEEAEWMQYFNEQKKKAQELKSDINRVDAEIDQMVYELYGLTGEEIRIVEGNNENYKLD